MPENLTQNKKLQEVFEKFMESVKKSLKQSGSVMPMCLIVFEKHDEEDLQIGMIPMNYRDDNEKALFIGMIKHMARVLTETPGVALLAIITGMDAYVSSYKADEINLDDLASGKIPMPSKDPNRKEALTFQLEEEFKKRSVTFEHMTTDDGEVVIRDKPLGDVTVPYDEKEDITNFGFLFPRKNKHSNN